MEHNIESYKMISNYQSVYYCKFKVMEKGRPIPGLFDLFKKYTKWGYQLVAEHKNILVSL